MSHVDFFYPLENNKTMDSYQKPKKKKKDNFLRHTKRHGKRGNFGRGRRLSEEEYNYYMRVFEQLKHVNGEEKEILVRNFFMELKREGQERSLSGNQIVSRILDDALPFAEVTNVLSLSRIFLTDLRPLCVDPFSSHVVQTLLTLALKYSQRGVGQKHFEESNEEGEEAKEITVQVTEEQQEEFCSFLEKVGRFVFNNLEDFVCDTYASHIIRSVLEVCSGVEVQRSVKSSQRSQLSHDLCKDKGRILTIPPKLKQLLKDLALRFKRLPDLPDIMSNDCGSAVLQSLVSVLGSAEESECEDMVRHLLEHGLPGVAAWYSNYQPQDVEEGTPSSLPPLFQDNPTIHLLEGMMAWCSSEQQISIYQDYFQGNIKVLVQHHHTSFAVQRLLSSWKDKETFEGVYEEVSVCLDVAAEAGRLAVVRALAEACRRLSAHQAQCMKSLMQLVNCWEPEKLQVNFAKLLLQLNSEQQQQTKSSKSPMSLQGALILQDVLHFHKPIKVVTSLLEMNSEYLQSMACDSQGSHVVDAFTSSTTVGAKSKEKFLYKFKGMYTRLACTKHGSHTLENLWKVASIKAKTQMCNELVTNELKLKSSQFGKIIYNNFQVGMFKRGDKEDWQELIDKTEKKRKMFEDLLEEKVSEKHKKKKKSKKEVNIPEEFMFIDTDGTEIEEEKKSEKKIDIPKEYMFIDTDETEIEEQKKSKKKIDIPKEYMFIDTDETEEQKKSKKKIDIPKELKIEKTKKKSKKIDIPK